MAMAQDRGALVAGLTGASCATEAIKQSDILGDGLGPDTQQHLTRLVMTGKPPGIEDSSGWTGVA